MSFSLILDGEKHVVEIVARRPHLVVKIGGRFYTIRAESGGGPGSGFFALDGERVSFTRGQSGETQHVRLGGRLFEAQADRHESEGGGGAGQDSIRAPMPGAVVRLHKRSGDAVARGEAVLTIESMKLQTSLTAPREGFVAEILFEEGAAFEKDAVVARLVPMEGD